MKVVQQIFLHNKHCELFSVWRYPESIKEIAVLIAGFGHPACDKDYFMSNLAQDLVDCGVLAIQLDLCGHGDSDGELVHLSDDEIFQDIQLLIDLIKEDYFLMQKPITIISRGVMGICLSKMMTKLSVTRCLAIAPPLFTEELCNFIINSFQLMKCASYNEYLCAENGLSEQETKNLFELLGAHHSNLRGQLIPFSFLSEHIHMHVPKQSRGTIWIANDGESYQCKATFTEPLLIGNLSEGTKLFSRDPEDKYYLCQTIINLF